MQTNWGALKAIIIALAAILSIAKYIEENVVTDARRKAVEAYLKVWHTKATSPDTIELLQNNFRFLSFLLDGFYGKKIVSMRLLTTTPILTAAFIFFSGICWYLVPSFPLAMHPLPSQILSYSANLAPTMEASFKTTKAALDKAKITPEQQLQYIAILETMERIDTPQIRIEFTFVCLMAFWGLGSFINILSMTFTRLLLRDLTNTNGIMIMLTSLLFNLIIITVLYALGILTICSILLPFIGALVAGSLILAFHWSATLMMWLLCTYCFSACALSPFWIKALVLLSLSPIVGIILCIILTVVSTRKKESIYGGINSMFLWVIEHKRGPLFFIISTLSIIFGTISTLAGLWSWK